MNDSIADSSNAPSVNEADAGIPLDAPFYLNVILFTFGVIFNLLTLITLSHSSLRGWSTQVLLAALSVVDTVALLMTFLLVLKHYKLATVFGPKSCKFVV